MKKLTYVVLLILLVSLLGACAKFSNDSPFKVKCPSCGYLWDHTPTENY